MWWLPGMRWLPRMRWLSRLRRLWMQILPMRLRMWWLWHWNRGRSAMDSLRGLLRILGSVPLVLGCGAS